MPVGSRDEVGPGTKRREELIRHLGIFCVLIFGLGAVFIDNLFLLPMPKNDSTHATQLRC